MALLTSNAHCSSPRSGGCRHRRGWRAVVSALLVSAVAWVVGTPPSHATDSLPPSQVKAAFVVNFPKYVEWPATAFPETNSPILIAVLGKTDVTAELQKIIEGRTVNGREIVLKRLTSGESPEGCHILFVSATEPPLSPKLLAKLTEAGVLTVGENDEFLTRGGIINLARRDQKIAVEVNLAAADQAGIKISSKLLSVARIVKVKSK